MCVSWIVSRVSSDESAVTSGVFFKICAGEDGKAKITSALKSATRVRNKDQLRIALQAAEEAGFNGRDEGIQEALSAYNELKDLTDTMRTRLIAEARSQGGDPNRGDWNPGNQYIAVFAVVAVAAIVAGKDILY